jgi:hypothetical protein
MGLGKVAAFSRYAGGYAGRVGLVACPFCREMFQDKESERCPVCGVKLIAFERLPQSTEALSEDGVPTAPELQVLPATYIGRGKGILAAHGVVGVVLFFLPWLHETMPNIVDYSGFIVARRLVWTWAVGVAWMVLMATVLSRRSIAQMRGARFAASMLAAIPALSTTILYFFPPHGGRWVTLRFTYCWPFWATLVASITAVLFALRLGGAADDIRVKRGTSAGQMLH